MNRPGSNVSIRLNGQAFYIKSKVGSAAYVDGDTGDRTELGSDLDKKLRNVHKLCK